MLIEGSFRHHRQTLAAYDEAFAAADDQHRQHLRSSLAAAAEEHRKALESALSAAEKRHREELAAQRKQSETVRRDWAGDWKELAAQFRELVSHRIWAQWNKNRAGEFWDITGGEERLAAESNLCASTLAICWLPPPRYLRTYHPICVRIRRLTAGFFS